jgi:hypothetical protein
VPKTPADKRGARERPAALSVRLKSWVAENSDVLIPVGVAFVVFAFTVTRHAIPSMLHDAYAYTMAAQRLVRDGVYAYSFGELPGVEVVPDARVTPGYILFLWLFYALLGRTGDPLQTVQAIQPLVVGTQFALALVTVAFLALSGRQLGGRRLALVTGLMGAAYLPFAWASLVALSESLAGPLLAAQLWWALRITNHAAKRSYAELFAFGVFSAVVVMVRPSMVLWVLVPLGYAIVARLESPKRLVLLALVAAAGFALVFAPWWVRNARVLGVFVPVRTDTIRTASGQYDSIATEPPAAMSTGQKMERALLVATVPWSAIDDVLWENSFHYDTMRVDFGRFPAAIHDRYAPLMKLLRYYQFFLLAAAIAALFFVRRSPRLLIAATVPIYAIGVHANTLVNPRYAYLGMPALIVLAGAGAYGVYHLAARRLRSS